MPTKKCAAAAAIATAALALPAPALAGPGHHGRGGGDGDVPARIASKLRAAERALDRAQERADDGETDKAGRQLTAVRRNLASALKSGKRRVVAGNETGEPSAAAISRIDSHVVSGTVSILDGAQEPVVGATATTLDAALDNRDEVVAAIAALADKSGYEFVLEDIVDDTADEVEAIDEALTDDELTAEARAALEAARTQAEATGAAAGSQITAASAAQESDATVAADDEECDRPRAEGGRRLGGPRGPRDEEASLS
jgi:hypothetical protein